MAFIIRLTTLTIFLIFGIGGCGVFVYISVLLVKSLKKYLKENTKESSHVIKMEKETDTAKKTLAERLKSYRIEKRMTQEYVAEQLGISRQAVSKWENGSCEPSTSNLVALAKLFEIDVSTLLSE